MSGLAQETIAGLTDKVIPEYLALKDAAKLTHAERMRLAKAGLARPDGSYPIRNRVDLGKAIEAFGRASEPDAVKAWIKKRARALGATSMLPENWT